MIKISIVCVAMQWTPLMKACQNGHAGVVSELLKAGAAVNATNKLADTALIIACDRGHENVVEILMEYGADATIQGYNGHLAENMNEKGDGKCAEVIRKCRLLQTNNSK